MRTIRTKVYKFSELSESAKQKAVENNSINSDYWGADEVLESLKGLAEHFNCELTDWSIDWLEGYRNNVRFEVPDYVNDWPEEDLKIQIEAMGAYNPKTLKGLGDCKFTGVCFDEDAADGVRKAYFEGERDMKELLLAGFNTWYKAAQNDFEYQLSEDGYKDDCEANNIEFTKDGQLFSR